jgi:hypothetical protein
MRSEVPVVDQYLAVIYAWTGEKDLAFEQLSVAARIPGYLSYGHLRLHPYWDPLRGDPRFEKVVASLATRNRTHAGIRTVADSWCGPSTSRHPSWCHY